MYNLSELEKIELMKKFEEYLVLRANCLTIAYIVGGICFGILVIIFIWNLLNGLGLLVPEHVVTARSEALIARSEALSATTSTTTLNEEHSQSSTEDRVTKKEE